ncbi:MAG TPA: hypothetical protein DD643_06310 [Synechococcus sp. UBA8638]|nr:hypothetical protein [Synechococcus sp. UBA8638]
MEGLFWLSEEQLERIKPFFPKSRGVSRVEDRKVLSGIIYVQRHGLRGALQCACLVAPTGD